MPASPATDRQTAEFPFRIGFDEACAIVDAVAAERRLAAIPLSLSRAHGHVQARDVVAGLPQPPFDNSAMDGFALRHADLAADGPTRLQLVGDQFAGLTGDFRLEPGQCLRITTGAQMPEGADTVVMKENTRIEASRIEATRIDGSRADGDWVEVLVAPRPGQHVRRAGEDSRVGDLLLRAGDVLTPSRIALAASQGIAQLDVARRPTVAVFATGDELVEPGMPLRPGQIYNSNREQLMGLLRAEGLEPVAFPTLPDDPAQITSALRHAGEAFDLVLTCGGVSAGEKDHLPALLQARGRVRFWKVRMKPGMPLLLAEGGTLGPALFLCLPGNPVSVLATWLAIGRRLVDGLQGRAPRPLRRARLTDAWHKRHERLEFLRGRWQIDAAGVSQVTPNPADGSHRMHAAADSDALIVLGEGACDYDAGAVVELLPY
ncbi:molybdopterin molybdotransferase MoeA [Luteimonas sp. BDR2-5]|uniref:molybdopterin molybdotransferase MoeA n=1 Tax=Proluteimonas luteida TaxID=2878685 RepID=UPI001E3A6753|nr:gephyrin-like molybdotransferase Glp [Luteimonas sp. BDR2-5]MCD9026991.1 molybdopterin molybdotransferase MoeA [Luteimonas sp. BDR2-5]